MHCGRFDERSDILRGISGNHLKPFRVFKIDNSFASGSRFSKVDNWASRSGFFDFALKLVSGLSLFGLGQPREDF